MPIIIPKDIPAFSILKEENIFVMARARAITQDIRPIEIAIVNLMPTKVETETQLLRLLSNSPLQINVTFINTATHESKNVSKSHLDKFYKTFDEIKDRKFDGMIVTGAPVEHMPFEEVDYWKELTQIFDFADKNVTSTIYICWGAQAGLYYHYGIQKHPLDEKLFGIFSHKKCAIDPLLKGVDDNFYIPHSRHTKVLDEDIYACKDLEVLASSVEAGCSILKSKDNKKIFLTGHSEYDRDTLKNEYLRDKNKGLDIKPPKNYFVDDSLTSVDMKWISTANLLYTNWLNYYVYQVTPFEL
ncbi:MAG: homoserine O-succinyltransferase [Clostridia bacterium]|nr:homoserine O-succinyltransferase [Clostridia bacterium]